MAIADVAEYAHLSAADVEALAVELAAIRLDIEDSRGANDRAYIQRTIAVQRCLDLAARVVIGAGRRSARGVHPAAHPPRLSTAAAHPAPEPHGEEPPPIAARPSIVSMSRMRGA